jgi:hypothetical protein
MAAAAWQASPSSRVAQHQPVGDDALLLLRVAFAAAVGQAVPQHAADELGVIEADAQLADRLRRLAPVRQPGLQLGAGLRVATHSVGLCLPQVFHWRQDRVVSRSVLGQSRRVMSRRVG